MINVITKAIFSIILALTGISCILFKDRIAFRLQQHYVKRSEEVYGVGDIGWDKPGRLTTFKIEVILFGIFLILGAIWISFGTINIRF
jgi:hypothetical protein